MLETELAIRKETGKPHALSFCAADQAHFRGRSPARPAAQTGGAFVLEDEMELTVECQNDKCDNKLTINHSELFYDVRPLVVIIRNRGWFVVGDEQFCRQSCYIEKLKERTL